MKTRMDVEAAKARKDNPNVLVMLNEMQHRDSKKLLLTYPDGREKIINGADLNLQKLIEHCDSQGVMVELVKDERS